MDDSPPTSVLLPTTGWNDACEAVANQLRYEDELLVVCDDAMASVAERTDDHPNVRLVVAGEPVGCSGKANAIAAGMEAAEHDRIVWTDDDFHHPSDWLSTLRADYERHGPASEVPVFVGEDPLAMLLEPSHAFGGTLAVNLADIPWGGSVIFDRDDLDEEAFLRDLRRTVSDDGLLNEYVDVTSVKRTREVRVGGSIRETVERYVRFNQIVRWHDPRGFAVQGAVGVLGLGAAVLFPLPLFALTTLAMAGVYATFGIRRWTFLLGYPGLFVAIPLMFYALLRSTFVWGGRRYRWRSKFDVRVEPE